MLKIFTTVFLLSASFLSAQELVFVEFKDKENVSQYLNNPLTMLSQAALDRRQKRNVVLDERDVPITQSYIDQVKTNYPILGTSKWLNGVVVNANSTSDLEQLASLGFVKEVRSFVRNPIGGKRSEPIKKFKENPFDVASKAQYSDVFIQQLNLQVLHNLGLTGKNVKLAIFDTGFPYVDQMQAFEYLRSNNRIKYTYDFVDHQTDVYDENLHNHGTMVLSNIAAKTNDYTGTGFDADIYLFRTEDNNEESPIEMVNWVSAAERADSLGVEIINSSLGYTTFDDSRYDYTHEDLDGKTAYITIGADIAAEKGIIVVTSAGNERDDFWGKISPPADGFKVLTIGAVTENGNYTSFSSYGPTADNRIKPDIMAMGQDVPLYYTSSWWGESLTYANGTSFSSPITAGAIASLIQDKSDFTIDELIKIMHESANKFQNPDNDYGYGIPNFANANDAFNDLSIDVPFAQKNQIYPNPTKGEVFIKNNSKIVSIEVYDQSGKLVKKNYDRSSIDLQTLPNGVYLLKIKDSKGKVVTQKLLKN